MTYSITQGNKILNAAKLTFFTMTIVPAMAVGGIIFAVAFAAAFIALFLFHLTVEILNFISNKIKNYWQVLIVIMLAAALFKYLNN